MPPSTPHGGKLQNLVASDQRATKLKEEAIHLPSWDLTPRQLWDLELLMNGAFSPLDGFLNREDWESVCRDMRLADGTLWPLPINLDVKAALAEGLNEGDQLVLRHPEGMPLAVLTVGDVWTPDLKWQAGEVTGTTSAAHPRVHQLLNQTEDAYVGGRVEGIELPPHHTFKHLRHTPAELRALFKKWGWNRIVGFQTRNPMHRAHFELTKQAAVKAEANLLIHPAVGRTKPGDIDYFVRVRCYQHLLKYYPEQTTTLSLLPLAMRMTGPRSALWHAIIRKNYGCTHFIVGRDHAGPGVDESGEPFYGPYDAQELVKAHEDELGIEMVPFREMVYVADRAEYLPRDEAAKDADVLTISGTEFRRRLKEGLEIPSWFTFPEVVNELRQSFPPRKQQGFTVFFTGLSGAGKSTVAQVLYAMLMEQGGRPVTLLDGDIVRKNLSSELGFSKEHRDLNIQRIGFVASEITKNGGVAICAPIAPYEATRREVRDLISEVGGFILVHVATPLDVCEARDRKGLYAKARAGIIKDFTGVDDPYEAPRNADVVLDTSDLTPDEAAQKVFLHLEKEGFIG